ncbi:DUF1173 family protein [Pseudomonas vanderleydeniana]|uniref:DUF1173 domain-containing protein n=1 Tax=Pseudomonas vanderleydeniana TaxID=2745495 RepID=A0A9E6PHK0_9PSED|nr:DUF1173 family protein [Pseudomonas vanderleydeniana]QXI26236.1 DUF1173 domain-containing protein [Pseudomonas vanderleydeniana]
MVYERFPVVIDGKPFSTIVQTQHEYASAWKATLEKAYGRTHATCRCPGRGARKLAIKRRDDTDGFHLARFAGTGPEHANECRFYAPAPERSGMQGYEVGVVEEGDDGTLRVRLARGLVERPARASTLSGARLPQSTSGTRKRAMTLLGLLCLVWQEARLNIWYPAMEGKRNSGQVHGLLRKTAHRIKAGRLMLHQVLMVSAAPRSKAEAANRTVTQQVSKAGRRALVISPLARFDVSQHDASMSRLPIAGRYGMPYLNLAQEVWESAQKRFPSEVAAWTRGERVMVMAQLNLHPGKAQVQAEVTDLALMHISPRWIPLDSGYESILESTLAGTGRSFEKPLRYDAGECEFFPDFWLLDMKRDFPLEVFGMDTPGYLAQKARKTEWYNRVYGPDGWWSWEAALMPDAGQVSTLPTVR